jgi:hypothetical protein
MREGERERSFNLSDPSEDVDRNCPLMAKCYSKHKQFKTQMSIPYFYTLDNLKFFNSFGCAVTLGQNYIIYQFSSSKTFCLAFKMLCQNP